MTKPVLTIALILSSLVSFAQQSEIVYYYSSRKLDNEVPRAKAKFSETIIENDSIKTRTVKDLKSNEIVYSNSVKGDEPVGVWIVQYGSGPRELDFNFHVRYSSPVCFGVTIEKDEDFFDNDEVNGYVAPKLEGQYKSLAHFISQNLYYPPKGVREGIQGRVDVMFEISKEGIVENLAVSKGVHVILDKEALRILRKMKFTTPPLVNGQPQRICVKMPVSFRLM